MSYSPTNSPVVRRGRNPLEIFILVFLLASGLAGLFTQRSSPALVAVLGSLTWIWHVVMLLGAGTAILSLFLKPLNDVLLERVGMIWLATCFLLYGAGICLIDPSFFSPATGLALGLGAGFAARAWQITKDLRRLRRVLQELPVHEGSP